MSLFDELTKNVKVAPGIKKGTIIVLQPPADDWLFRAFMNAKEETEYLAENNKAFKMEGFYCDTRN